MNDDQLFRNYSINDSDLTVFVQHIADVMVRDISEFANYGISTDDISNLLSMNNEFAHFPTDRSVREQYLSAIERRNNLMNTLQNIIWAMALRVELKWGKKSPKSKSLGISDMGRLTVEAYLTRARMIYSFIYDNQYQLSSEGLTQEMLDNMELVINELDAVVHETLEKASNRGEKTIERIRKGNDLYSLLSNYCEIGKRIWNKVNPAYYRDYLIYGKSSKTIQKSNQEAQLGNKPVHTSNH